LDCPKSLITKSLGNSREKRGQFTQESVEQKNAGHLLTTIGKKTEYKDMGVWEGLRVENGELLL